MTYKGFSMTTPDNNNPEPVGEIIIGDDGTIMQKYAPGEKSIDVDTFELVVATGYSVGYAEHDQIGKVYFIEFHHPAIDGPLRVGLNQQLTEGLVGSLIDVVES